MAYKKSLESQSDYQHIKSIIENKISSYKQTLRYTPRVMLKTIEQKTDNFAIKWLFQNLRICIYSEIISIGSPKKPDTLVLLKTYNTPCGKLLSERGPRYLCSFNTEISRVFDPTFHFRDLCCLLPKQSLGPASVPQP